jgi:hypothetical protein
MLLICRAWFERALGRAVLTSRMYLQRRKYAALAKQGLGVFFEHCQKKILHFEWKF